MVAATSPPPLRSHGAVLLARTSLTERDIAARVGGVERAAVGHWKTGRKRPGPKNRETLRALFGIPVEAWDRPATGPWDPPPSQPPAGDPTQNMPIAGPGRGLGTTIVPPPPSDTFPTPRALAATLIQQASSLLHQAQTDKTMTPRELAKVMDLAGSAITRAGRLTGDSQTISEDRLVHMPAFRRVSEALVEATKEWPDAQRAIGEALLRLEAIG